MRWPEYDGAFFWLMLIVIFGLILVAKYDVNIQNDNIRKQLDRIEKRMEHRNE